MAEVPGTFVRQYVGKRVRITLLDGRVFDAELLSFDGRSLWLVADGEDRFVPLSDVAALRAAAVKMGPLPLPGRPASPARPRRPPVGTEGCAGHSMA
jgi:hypothetical protein